MVSAGRVAMPRWVLWLIWAVVFGIAPYGLSALVAWIASNAAPVSIPGLFGSGQLLVTSIALVGVALRELLHNDGRGRRELRYLLMVAAVLHLLVLGSAFGLVTGLGSIDPTQVPRELVTNLSFVTYIASVVISGLTLLVPGPGRNVQSQGGATS
jgi:hypothetical protein